MNQSTTVQVHRTNLTTGSLAIETHPPETVVAAVFRALAAGEAVQVLRPDGSPIKRAGQGRGDRYRPF